MLVWPVRQGIVGLAYSRLALPNASVTTWPEAAQQVLLGRLSAFSVVLCGPQPSTGRHHGYIEFGEYCRPSHQGCIVLLYVVLTTQWLTLVRALPALSDACLTCSLSWNTSYLGPVPCALSLLVLTA